MNIKYNSFPIKNVLNHIHKYNEKKYWKRRNYIIKPGGIKLKKLYYLLYIKKCDSFNNASLGTDLNHGASFESIPKFPHGLNGIVISPDAQIGKNCIIFHQVTIGNDYKNTLNAPIIGDNVTIYPGAKIVGKVTVGNNCVIGPNAVVFKNVPDDTTVVVGDQRYLSKG